MTHENYRLSNPEAIVGHAGEAKAKSDPEVKAKPDPEAMANPDHNARNQTQIPL